MLKVRELPEFVPPEGLEFGAPFWAAVRAGACASDGRHMVIAQQVESHEDILGGLGEPAEEFPLLSDFPDMDSAIRAGARHVVHELFPSVDAGQCGTFAHGQYGDVLIRGKDVRGGRMVLVACVRFYRTSAVCPSCGSSRFSLKQQSTHRCDTVFFDERAGKPVFGSLFLEGRVRCRHCSKEYDDPQKLVSGPDMAHLGEGLRWRCARQPISL